MYTGDGSLDSGGGVWQERWGGLRVDGLDSLEGNEKSEDPVF